MNQRLVRLVYEAEFSDGFAFLTFALQISKYWVAFSTPKTLSPAALSLRVLSLRASSPGALSPNVLRNAWKNQTIQLEFLNRKKKGPMLSLEYHFSRPRGPGQSNDLLFPESQ